MVLAFLITTLVLFVLNLGVNLLTIAVNINDPDKNVAPSVIGLFVSLIMITWNIFAIVSL